MYNSALKPGPMATTTYNPSAPPILHFCRLLDVCPPDRRRTGHFQRCRAFRPDWPLSYGSLTPPMVGGIRYEHSHRADCRRSWRCSPSCWPFGSGKRTNAAGSAGSAWRRSSASSRKPFSAGKSCASCCITGCPVMHACFAQIVFAALVEHRGVHQPLVDR